MPLAPITKAKINNVVANFRPATKSMTRMIALAGHEISPASADPIQIALPR